MPLYGRVPAGVGTPLVESLTSFVSRLAMARHLKISKIFNYLIRPLVPQDLIEGEDGYSYWYRGFIGNNAVVWNGHGKHVQALVDALTELTGLAGLGCHTLLPLEGLLSTERGGVIDRERGNRWCAACLAGWRREGMQPWEPLLWRISFVKRCVIHGTVFSDVCATCKKSQDLVPDKFPFGYCRECRRHVESGDPQVSKRWPRTPGAWRWEWELSRAVGRMLASQKALAEFASNRGFMHLLSSLKQHPEFGSFRRVGGYIGTTPHWVKEWLEGAKHPGLLTFLRVCIRVGVDPVAVAIYPHGESLEVRGELRFGIQPRSKCRGMKERPAQTWGPAKWNKVRSELVELLKSPEVGLHPAGSVAERLGVAASTLKKHCPNEYAALKKARAAWLADERKRRFAERETALRTAFEDCLRKGLYPSKNLVFERAGFSSALYKHLRYRELFRKIRRDNGFI